MWRLTRRISSVSAPSARSLRLRYRFQNDSVQIRELVVVNGSVGQARIALSRRWLRKKPQVEGRVAGMGTLEVEERSGRRHGPGYSWG